MGELSLLHVVGPLRQLLPMDARHGLLATADVPQQVLCRTKLGHDPKKKDRTAEQLKPEDVMLPLLVVQTKNRR